MEPSDEGIIEWFARTGERYVASYLGPNRVDVERLRRDPAYGLTLFLFIWAYERSQAPRGYRIAAVKAIAATWPDLTRLSEEYARFYTGKRNDKLNPAMDPVIANLDIPAVLRLVEQGHLAEAFVDLRLRGVGPKIRMFFLRDLVTLTGAEAKVNGLANHLYCQPIDVWVRLTVGALDLVPDETTESVRSRTYGVDVPGDFDAAKRLIAAAQRAAVSPLRVNQGIWYFCANSVGDAGRLAALLRTGNSVVLDRELALMEEFLP